MCIDYTKLQYGVEKQSILVQEHMRNICRVSIIELNRMKEMKITISYIYLLHKLKIRII